jgi:hypothetical protein
LVRRELLEIGAAAAVVRERRRAVTENAVLAHWEAQHDSGRRSRAFRLDELISGRRREKQRVPVVCVGAGDARPLCSRCDLELSFREAFLELGHPLAQGFLSLLRSITKRGIGFLGLRQGLVIHGGRSLCGRRRAEAVQL